MNYFGSVLDSGDDFAEVSTDGGIVKIKFFLPDELLVVTVGVDRRQAKELARHLSEAATVVADDEQTPCEKATDDKGV